MSSIVCQCVMVSTLHFDGVYLSVFENNWTQWCRNFVLLKSLKWNPQ